MPMMRSSFAGLISANASPNRPVALGSHKGSISAAATAASTALAAPLQQIQRDLGRERMRCGSHAVLGIDGRPARGLEVSHGLKLGSTHRQDAIPPC
jgi:hypothetical protein